MKYDYDQDLLNRLSHFQSHAGVHDLLLASLGLIPPFGISAPIVDIKAGKVVAFINPEEENHRQFPVDMSGFAVHLSLLFEKAPKMPYRATWEEEGFLVSLDVR